MKYGFVYVWHDRKNKMFYVGCHWGTEDDGYICSSERMRSAYRRRPDDFKRRIVSRVNSNRKDLLTEEHKWLSQIKDEELGKKFYNLSKKHFGHWSLDDRSMLSTKEKMSAARRGKSAYWNVGKKASPERRIKISEKHKGSFWITDGITTKQLRGEEIPDGWRRGRGPLPKQSESAKAKAADSRKGRVWVSDGKINKFVPISKIPDGWTSGRAKYKS